MVTFDTTVQAMAAEAHLTAHRIPGRLIPVPREITAGCGLAWKAPPEDRNTVLSAMMEAGLDWAAMYELEI